MKYIKYLIVIILIIILSGCFFGNISPKPSICDSNLNVTEEDVRNDLDVNKNEYLELIDLLSNYQISYIYYYEDSSKDILESINLDFYTGNNEDFNNGNLDGSYIQTDNLLEVEYLTQNEVDIIHSFIQNRNSKKIIITNKAKGDGKIYFEFFGLTYIIYENDRFYIENKPCPNA